MTHVHRTQQLAPGGPLAHYEVRDSEGRVYGYYRTREEAQDACASAQRGYPWRRIYVA